MIIHRGLLTAAMMCELVQLDAAAVRDAVKANLDMKKHVKRLCVGYAAILTQEELELVRFFDWLLEFHNSGSAPAALNGESDPQEMLLRTFSTVNV